VAALVFFLADVVVIVVLLAPLAQKMGKECATQAPTAYHATTDQKAGDPTFVQSAFLFVIWASCRPLAPQG
jgi:hypothetical protein